MPNGWRGESGNTQPYRSRVGALNYLRLTRPDMMCSNNILYQFNKGSTLRLHNHLFLVVCRRLQVLGFIVSQERLETRRLAPNHGVGWLRVRLVIYYWCKEDVLDFTYSDTQSRAVGRYDDQVSGWRGQPAFTRHRSSCMTDMQVFPFSSLVWFLCPCICPPCCNKYLCGDFDSFSQWGTILNKNQNRCVGLSKVN